MTHSSPNTARLSWTLGKCLIENTLRMYSQIRACDTWWCCFRPNASENRWDNAATIHPVYSRWRREGKSKLDPSALCPCSTSLFWWFEHKRLSENIVNYLIKCEISFPLLRDELCPPQKINILKYQIQVPQIVLVFGDKVFKEAIKLKWG